MLADQSSERCCALLGPHWLEQQEESQQDGQAQLQFAACRDLDLEDAWCSETISPHLLHPADQNLGLRSYLHRPW